MINNDYETDGDECPACTCDCEECRCWTGGTCKWCGCLVFRWALTAGARAKLGLDRDE